MSKLSNHKFCLHEIHHSRDAIFFIDDGLFKGVNDDGVSIEAEVRRRRNRWWDYYCVESIEERRQGRTWETTDTREI